MRAHQIARVAHEVNRAYCAALGDNSQPAWIDAPQWQKDSALLGVKLHTENDVGPEASHASWMAQKVAEGWVYGATKDPIVKTHPCIVPFDQLPREQQAKDFIFRGVVHALNGDKLQMDIAYAETAARMWAAYSAQGGGLTFDGKKLPTWAELGEERQACWIAAAQVA